MELAPTNPAVLSARTIYTQTVRPVTGRETVLKRCANTKLGGDKARIKKGIWKGFPVYTLTLQALAHVLGSGYYAVAGFMHADAAGRDGF